MEKKQLIDQLLLNNNGYVKTSEIIDENISKTYFAAYRKEKNLIKVAQGLFMTPEAWQDDLYILQLRYPEAIFSHETASYLLDMTDREPMERSITLKAGKGSARLNKEGIKVYKVKEDLLTFGLIEVLSPSGHKIRTYNKERTVCDLLRSRKKIEAQEIQSVLREYFHDRDRNIPQLMRYSKLFSVENIVKRYTEVLL
ncbi:MAG: abortive phage infection protein [Erysipelotrichaceae bacterium]